MAPSSSASAPSSQKAGYSQRGDFLDKKTWTQQKASEDHCQVMLCSSGQVGHWAGTCTNPPEGSVSPTTNFFVHAAPEQSQECVQRHWLVQHDDKEEENIGVLC
eukprot:808633-Amphidinium_carterae.1